MKKYKKYFYTLFILKNKSKRDNEATKETTPNKSKTGFPISSAIENPVGFGLKNKIPENKKRKEAAKGR